MNQMLQSYINEHKKEGCCEESITSKITLKDTSSGSASLKLTNKDNQKIIKIQVDGCLIDTEKIKRCDWIVCKEHNDKIIFVELKNGFKWTDIFKQFISTKELIWKENKINGKCILVYKKFSKMTKTRNQSKQKGIKTLKQNGLVFETYKENQPIEDLWLNN